MFSNSNKCLVYSKKPAFIVLKNGFVLDYIYYFRMFEITTKNIHNGVDFNFFSFKMFYKIINYLKKKVKTLQISSKIKKKNKYSVTFS